MLYLTTLNKRAGGWRTLSKKPSRARIQAAFSHCTAQQIERMWNTINHLHYHVKDIDGFINVLVELCVEEHVKFRNYADTKKIREYLKLADIDLGSISNEYLLLLYLSIRDGQRIHVLNNEESELVGVPRLV
jgi:hypothetical protein